MNNLQSEMEQLLKDISILDFALVDFSEYLDTHPFDKQAIAYFNHYNKIRMDLTRQFSEKYYPLQTSFPPIRRNGAGDLPRFPGKATMKKKVPALNVCPAKEVENNVEL